MTDLPMLRTSERKAFKRCPQQWWWAYKEGLVKRQQTGGALWFGTGIHLALEKWYVRGVKRGVEPQETWAQYVDDRLEVVKAEVVSGERAAIDSEWVDAKELGDKILANYRRVYGRDEKWEVLSPEQTLQVLIPQRGTKAALVKYVATLDLVARDLETGRIWLWDHKTAASIQLGHLPLDDQAGSYYAIAKPALVPMGMMKPNESLKGILYNFIMKSPPDERPVNADGLATNAPSKAQLVQAAVDVDLAADPTADGAELSKTYGKLSVEKLRGLLEHQGAAIPLGEVSKTQPAKRLHREPVPRTKPEQRKQIERIADEATVMQAKVRGDLPIYKTPTSECNFCQFRQMCELDEKGGDVDEFIDAVYDSKTPTQHTADTTEENPCPRRSTPPSTG